MSQILMILLAASLMARDQIGKPAIFAALGPTWVAVLTLVPHLVIVAGCVICLRMARLRLERTGDLGLVGFADTVLSFSRWASAVWHVLAVLGLGWLDAVRSATGNTIVVDEVVALLPPLLVFVGGWWGLAPIDTLLRHAVIVRSLDTGAPLHAPPTRGAFVLMQVRLQLALLLVPLVGLMAWSEGVRMVLTHLDRRARGLRLNRDSLVDRTAAWVHSSGQGELIHTGLQVVGMVIVFALMPLVLRVIWDTVGLPAGELRERLLALCRAHGVRIANVLVWRTHGSLANGAVIGVFGRLRYVLLSDVLIETLGEDELMAVMAHEIGHVRRRHMVWLAVALLVCTAGGATALALVGQAGLGALAMDPEGEYAGLVQGLVDAVMSLSGVVLGLMAFGWVSRRFEWQADAFAAQHLSGWRTGGEGRSDAARVPRVSEEAVGAMVGALDAVARLNHLDRRRFTWRHGSIARRAANLRGLVGEPVDRLRIDRVVGWTKAVCGLVACGLVAAAIWL